MHYLPATALAVEATTVLHSFVWHQRWTWRDRRRTASPGASAAICPFSAAMKRLGRPVRESRADVAPQRPGRHSIPIAANMPLDRRAARFSALPAAHALVFAASRPPGVRRNRRDRRSQRAPLIVPLSAAGRGRLPPSYSQRRSPPGKATERQVDERYQRATANAFCRGCLQADRQGGARMPRPAGRQMIQLRSPVPGAPGADVPDGRIHHWVGAIFRPGTTVDQVVKLSRGKYRAGIRFVAMTP